MSESGFTRRSKRVVYENPWIRFEAHEIVHPNGQPGEHGLVAVPAASAVVAIDGEDVILARQARFAADRVMLEVVKGGAHPGEDARATAQRELREELGLFASRWDDLGEVWEVPSIVATPVHLFLARDLRVVGTAFEDVESIESARLPFVAALAMAERGEITDAMTAAALLRAAPILRAGR